MAEIRIQVATHFTIDPAKQILGTIQYPEKVTVTAVVGDEITPQKMDFAIAFTPDQKAFIEDKLNEKVKEVLRTAKPVDVSISATDPGATTGTAPGEPSGVAEPTGTEGGFELF